jgi:adenosylhomocysteine nucleosidase
MERIVIFAALQWECRPVLQHVRGVMRQRIADFTIWRGQTARQEVWLIKTGVGVQRAAAAATLMSEAGGVTLFFSTGCAGGLLPGLQPGDITVAAAVIADASGQRFETHAAERARAHRAAERAALRATVAPLLCSPHMLATAAAKRAAAAQHGALGVEMEGAPIAACAAQAGIPFVAVRAILDGPDTELRHGGRFLDPASGRLKPLALAGYVATHPGALSDLLALQRMGRAAQQSLDRFFRAWFAEP